MVPPLPPMQITDGMGILHRLQIHMIFQFKQVDKLMQYFVVVQWYLDLQS